MSRSMSYQAASKHSHKMASKYSAHEGETETLTIGNGWEKNWVELRKDELMKIPWMKEAIEAKGAKLFIDDCLGFDISNVTDAGAIELKSGGLLRISKNSKKPSRFLLREFYRNSEGLWELDPNYPREIRSATVSTAFSGKCFSDGERKYLYSKDGKELLVAPPVYDEYTCSCCCHEDYEWD